MNINELKNLDPQSHVTVRFGIVHDDGSTEWDDHWMQIRILVADGTDGNWFLSPMSLDGRPYSLTMEGHTSEAGVFASQNTHHVMQLLNLAEPMLLRDGYEAGDLEGFLLDRGMIREDLSEVGKVFFDAVTEFGDDIVDNFLERILQIAEGSK